MIKKALVTGITGQDGSYLAELLLKKGYEVYGMVRRSSLERYDRIQEVIDKLHLMQGDLSDQSSLDTAIREILPDEVYNLAAQSFVPTSFTHPVMTADITGLGVTRLLDAIRKYKPDAKFYQASSSEMFGKVQEVPQNEKTPFYPRSPYGVAKVYGHWITVNYRESYNIFAVSGILFNHESERRGLEFISRKVSDAVAKIKLGLINKLSLGNLEAKRDWGYAPDYMEAVYLMLQQEKPENYVIATGISHSVRELVEVAFSCVGLDWKDYVVTDAKFLRPTEVDFLVGDATYARNILKWHPKTTFNQMIKKMVEADIKRYQKK